MRNYGFALVAFFVGLGGAALANFTYSIPTAGVTAGPTWASQISAALLDLQTHTHTGTGTEGPTLGTAAIVENATHQMNDNSISEINGLYFNDGTSTTPGTYSLYITGNELTYKDESGNVIPLTSGAANSIRGVTQSDRYMSIWQCAFSDAVPGTYTDGAAEYDDTLGETWEINCPLPTPQASSVTIDAVYVYANTADSNCDIDSASIQLDNITNSTTATVSNSKTNEAFGTSYAAISFTTDVAVTSSNVAWLYLAPGNDGGGNCDQFFFYGYRIVYTSTTTPAGWWNN